MDGPVTGIDVPRCGRSVPHLWRPFAILGTGATHFLDKTHEWGSIEFATIAAISSLGIALMGTAWKIASNIGSED